MSAVWVGLGFYYLYPRQNKRRNAGIVPITKQHFIRNFNVSFQLVTTISIC